MKQNDVYFVPIHDKFLIHAPLHKLTALINQSALHALRASLMSDDPLPIPMNQLASQLQNTPLTTPSVLTGDDITPYFLGLIPTRGCNMACPYCDFAAPKRNSPVMSLNLARDAVNAYFALIQKAGQGSAEVHFFGGEPFFAEKVVHFVVEYAKIKALEHGIRVRFEATSNGLYNRDRCKWIAEHFDTVVLSLDGPPDIQDSQRPAVGGRTVSSVIVRNAKVFSDNDMELVIRACITDATVHRMPEIAQWISHEFRPSTVCFEILSLSHTAQSVAFAPPDPWEFARNFDQASQILSQYGIKTIISTADLHAPRLSFCPVGKDALIVSPDGMVDACYLLQKDWEAVGLDMRLGSLTPSGFELHPEAVDRARNMTVESRALCANCLCRYYCAGGCHVNHDTTGAAGQYDRHCILTRMITVTQLLRTMGQHTLADEWLGNRALLEETILQENDRLLT